MSQSDLSKRNPAKYRFLVAFYVSGLGNIYTRVDIDRNDEKYAIQIVEQKLGLEHPEQAEAFLVSSPTKT